mgnify:CR=1 FL=1
MSNTAKIEVRDLRTGDWLWTHKAVLFHTRVDGNGFKVYCGLASYANNNDQSSFPSIDTLAKRLHIKSRTTIIKSLKLLEDLKLLRVERRIGRHNVYYLLNPEPQQFEEVPQKPEKETEPAKTDAGMGAIINQLIEGFEPVNPTFARLFKIKQQRDALQRLVKQFGIERVQKMIAALPEVVGKPYAPVITKPTELENKLGQLRAFVMQAQKAGKKEKEIIGL